MKVEWRSVELLVTDTLGGWVVEEGEWASAMASRMRRTERTTFSWTTALHDARSSRNACYQA